MATYQQCGKLAVVVIFYLAALCPMPEVSCVSYPLNHKGLLPTGKKLGPLGSTAGREERSLKKPKKKLLSVSKNLFQKLSSNQAEMEKDADREAVKTTNPHTTVNITEPQRKQIKNPHNFFDTPRRFPESMMKSKNNATHLDSNSTKAFVYKPYYDCPLFSNDVNGQAIIKPDPFDCGCFYYCGWGVHHVQCCSWPLLWNDDIKSCDWYWKVFCYTTDYWKKK